MTTSRAHLTSQAFRKAAHDHLRLRNQGQAEKAFVQLMETSPFDVEALQFVADCHYARGELSSAQELLSRARLQEPGNADVSLRLGAVQVASGDFQSAAGNLRDGLSHQPGAFVSRLQLGIALEQLGLAGDALTAYFAAIRTAQGRGRWISEATTAAGLRGPVKYAIDYANAGRRKLFAAVIAPLLSRYGASELQRVEQSLAIYLGEQPPNIPDPRQRPSFLYFPGVPSQPYYPKTSLPWIGEIESAFEGVRNELQALLAQDPDLEPFLGSQSEQLLGSSSAKGQASWDAYFFYRHGERHDEHCTSCPVTASLLDKSPLVRIREHAPEALFSVLSSGSHILPHRGVTNTRLVTHLPLIVPNDCALRVGGETHIWREGQCITFDDTFEHEAWNRSDQTRVVLIMDSWNPDLTEVERVAITDLVEAIGDFNIRAEDSVSDTPLAAPER